MRMNSLSFPPSLPPSPPLSLSNSCSHCEGLHLFSDVWRSRKWRRKEERIVKLFIPRQHRSFLVAIAVFAQLILSRLPCCDWNEIGNYSDLGDSQNEETAKQAILKFVWPDWVAFVRGRKLGRKYILIISF